MALFKKPKNTFISLFLWVHFSIQDIKLYSTSRIICKNATLHESQLKIIVKWFQSGDTTLCNYCNFACTVWNMQHIRHVMCSQPRPVRHYLTDSLFSWSFSNWMWMASRSIRQYDVKHRAIFLCKQAFHRFLICTVRQALQF